MVVVVLTACPTGLRGDLTRWLFEVAPGVFVGHVSARIRERLWERIVSSCEGWPGNHGVLGPQRATPGV